MSSPRKEFDIEVKLEVLSSYNNSFYEEFQDLEEYINKTKDIENPIGIDKINFDITKRLFVECFHKYELIVNELKNISQSINQDELLELKRYLDKYSAILENENLRETFSISKLWEKNQAYWKSYFNSFYHFEDGLRHLEDAKKRYAQHLKTRLLNTYMHHLEQKEEVDSLLRLEGQTYKDYVLQYRKNFVPDDLWGVPREKWPKGLKNFLHNSSAPLFINDLNTVHSNQGVVFDQNSYIDIHGGDFLWASENSLELNSFDRYHWVIVAKLAYSKWKYNIDQCLYGNLRGRKFVEQSYQAIQKLQEKLKSFHDRDNKEIVVFFTVLAKILDHMEKNQLVLESFLKKRRSFANVEAPVIKDIDIDYVLQISDIEHDRNNDTDIENSLKKLLPQEFMPNQEGFENDQNTYPMVWMNNIQTSPYYDPDLPYTYNPNEEQYIPQVPLDPNGNMIEFQPSWISVVNEALDTVEEIYENHPEVIEIPAAVIGTKVASQKLAPAIQKATKTGSLNRINNVVRPSSTTSPMRTDYSRGINYNGYMLGGANGFGGGSAKSYSK